MIRASVLVASLALIAGGCGGATGADKAGGTKPLTLTMANGYDPSLELEPAVAYFVARVRTLSRGAVRIRVIDDWAGNAPGFEQRIVRDTAAGKADIAWVGTRVFDTLGVKSLDALSAPMLIDSYPLERAVIADEVSRRMLSGVGTLGVTGLGVLAGGLRKPIAVEQPLDRPADWRGLRFSLIRSGAEARAVRALGADPTEFWGAARQDAVGARKIDAFEMNLYLWSFVIDPAVARYSVANLNLWPETAALIVNSGRYHRLSTQQRAWLSQAATDAAARSTSFFSNEAPLVKTLCADGARFSDASADELAAFRRAFAPVYRTLDADDSTSRAIERIESLKRNLPSAVPLTIPPTCRARPPRRVAPRAQAVDPDVLDGVYRVKLTDEELAAAGKPSAFSRPSFGGLITLTLHNGRLHFQPGTPPVCNGTYSVSSDTVRFRIEPATYCQGTVTARWSLTKSRLSLHVVTSTNPNDAFVWGSKPWRKIG